MELVRQNQRRLRLPQFPIQLHLPRYISLMLCLLLGIMVIVVGTTVLTGLMQPPLNPFTAYDDLIAADTHDPAFGSNSTTLFNAALDLACTTTFTARRCLYKPDSRPFSEIRLMDVDDRGKIAIYFAVRDHTLTVGDVALLWGRPTVVRRDNSLVLHWPEQRVSTVVRSDNRQFNYRLPVPYLLIGEVSE